MKEYIPKEYLQDYANAHGEVVDWAEAEVVTKADICREFAEKVKQMMKMPEYGFCDIERIMEIALEEME